MLEDKMIPIRKGNLNDAQALSTLAMSLGKYYNDNDPLGINPFFQKVISVESIEKYLQDERAYENYVYEENQKVIGYISLLNGSHIFLLFVDEKHHKNGVARALIDHAMKSNEKPSYSVNASLYAVAFYEKLGFSPSALVQRHHGMSYQPMIKNRVS